MNSVAQQTKQTPQTAKADGSLMKKSSLITQKFIELPPQIAGLAIGRKGSIGKGLTSGKFAGITLKSYNVNKTDNGVEIAIVGTPFNILKAEKWLLENIPRWIQTALGNTQCLWFLNPKNKAFVLQIQGPPQFYGVPVGPIPVMHQHPNTFRPASPEFRPQSPPTKSTKSSSSMPSTPTASSLINRSVSV